MHGIAGRRKKTWLFILLESFRVFMSPTTWRASRIPYKLFSEAKVLLTSSLKFKF